MKLLLAIFLSFAVCSSIAGECLKIEYQELKEWTEEQLVKKFCEDTRDYDNHVAMESFWVGSAKLSKTLGDSNGSLKDWEKSSVSASKAKVCKNEMERTSKLLLQRNLEEAAIVARCPKAGSIVPQPQHPKIQF